MRTKTLMIIGTLLVLMVSGCTSIPEGLGPLKTVDSVDVKRYLGRW